MVKFSKQFEARLVPEWKEAFVDYSQLKKYLNKIHLLDSNQISSNKFVSSLRKYTFLEHNKHKQHSLIQVHKKLSTSASKGNLYETELIERFSDTDEAAVVREFFSCLDSQLNKVNAFFSAKEKEFLDRGESLKNQMEILVELNTSLSKKREDDSNEDFFISATISCDEGSNREITEIDLSDSPKYGALGKSIDRVVNFRQKNVRIHIPLTNPTRTFSAITFLLWDDLINQSSKKRGTEGNKLHLNTKKLYRADKMIRGAFIELYKGLGYLKTYRNLNMLAFVKILKKFDKVTNKQVLPIYLRVVESSYFNSSDKILKLEDEVEELFVKHFAKDDRTMAVKYLKPTHTKESHSLTFFVGLFTGFFVALLVAYVIIAHTTGIYEIKSDSMYMETVYPVLSMFSLLFLHLFLYGCNIVMWRKTRINYSFIFELSPTNKLTQNGIFLICSTSMAAVVGIFFAHLSLVAKGYSFSRVQAIPGIMLLGFILVLVCPFNVIYKSSRYRFISVVRNIIFSPLYKVVMLDFFMADQLCSQVPMLRELEYVACYYITGSYKNQDYQYCMRNTYYRDLAYAVSFLPYYWRSMQCARRWFDEGEKSHLLNLGKYVSAMLAAGAKVAYEKEKTVGWFCLVVVLSSAATLYQLYWDFVKDWGLLRFDSKNPWLRDELMLRQKFIYFLSMGLNLVLRLAWLQTVFHYNFGKVDYRVTMLFLAALEVVRRGQWNFYRLENEHLNNAGKYRAVKTVPLPFHEVDEQD
ncbi:hypothetical protein ACP275_12G084200 [Erythranthe tilingii]